MPSTPVPPQTVELLGNIRELLCDVVAASDSSQRSMPDHLVETVYETIIEIDRAVEASR
jgi:hypothetical protein